MNHHLKDEWKPSGQGHYTKREDLYINFFEKYISNFSGSCIEIGPGTGKFAEYLLDNNEISSYTILDIESNIKDSRNLLSKGVNFPKVSFTRSCEYELIFEKEYDLFIAIQCLSETPSYYYSDIMEKIKAEKLFILDGSRYDNFFTKSVDQLINKYEKKTIIEVPELYPNHKPVVQKLYIASELRSQKK